MRGTVMLLKTKGSVRNADNKAPCQPSSCHLPSLSLHALQWLVMSGKSNACVGCVSMARMG